MLGKIIYYICLGIGILLGLPFNMLIIILVAPLSKTFRNNIKKEFKKGKK